MRHEYDATTTTKLISRRYSFVLLFYAISITLCWKFIVMHHRVILFAEEDEAAKTTTDVFLPDKLRIPGSTTSRARGREKNTAMTSLFSSFVEENNSSHVYYDVTTTPGTNNNSAIRRRSTTKIFMKIKENMKHYASVKNSTTKPPPRIVQKPLYTWQPNDIQCNDTVTTMLPDFIIAGVQKAGTTALYKLLQRQHSNMKSSYRFETHFFDFHNRATNAADTCRIREQYSKEFYRHDDSSSSVTKTPYTAAPLQPQYYYYEKTPSYLCHPHIASAIKKVVPWVKIVIVLRDPTHRAFSAWRMHSKGKQYISFIQLIRDNVKLLRKLGIWNSDSTTTDVVPSRFEYQLQRLKMQQQQRNATLFSTTTTTTTDIVSLPRIHAPRIDLTNITAHDNKKIKSVVKLGMCSVIGRGLYAPQLEPWIQAFGLENIKVIRYESFLQDRAAVLSDVLQFVVGAAASNDHHTLSNATLTRDYRPHPKKTRYDNPMDDITYQYLKALYRPYNEQLADLLGEGWRGVWE